MKASAHSQPFSVCVYCGSRPGHHPAYLQAAQDLGRLIGQRGWRLVYGGGGEGLMGTAASAALDAGGQVLGVIPQRLVDREHAHPDLTELRIVQTMHQRKHLMADEAHAFIALPGGLGTLEEIFEIWTWRQLGYHHKPVGLLNVEGYFDPLIAMTQRAVDQGFVSPEHNALLRIEQDPQALLDALAEA